MLLVQQVVQTRAVQQGLCGLYAAQFFGQLHACGQAGLPGRNAQALELCLCKAVVLEIRVKVCSRKLCMADGAVGVGSQVLQIQALGLQAVQLAAVVAEKADGVRAYAGGDGQQHTDVLAHHVEGGVLRCSQGLHTYERGHDAETREDCKGSDGRAQKCADAALRRPLITGQHVIQLALEFARHHGAGIEQQGDGGSHQHGHFGPLVEQAFGVEVDGHEVRGHKEGGHGDRDVVQQAALGAALFLDVVELFGHVGVFTHVHSCTSWSYLVLCFAAGVRLPVSGCGHSRQQAALQ